MKNSKLTISRTNQYANRMRKITLFVDDDYLGTIRNGETKSFYVNEGNHNLKAKIDWCVSKPLTIQASPENEISIELGSPMKFRKKELLFSFLQLLLLFGSIYSMKLTGNEWIFWTGMSLLILWFLGELFFIKGSSKLALYYITFGRNKYLYLKEIKNTRVHAQTRV